jgi:hypothetical protein
VEDELHELKDRLADLTAAVDALLEKKRALLEKQRREADGDPPLTPPS